MKKIEAIVRPHLLEAVKNPVRVPIAAKVGEAL